MAVGALRIGTFPKPGKEDALRNQSLLVLMEVHAIRPVDAGTTEPMPTNFVLEHSMERVNMPFSTQFTVSTGALLIVGTNLRTLFDHRFVLRKVFLELEVDTGCIVTQHRKSTLSTTAETNTEMGNGRSIKLRFSSVSSLDSTENATLRTILRPVGHTGVAG